MIAKTRIVSAFALVISVAAGAPSAQAQQNSMPAGTTAGPAMAPSSAAENSSTTSVSELKPEKPSAWKGSVLFVFDRNGRIKTAAEDETTTSFQTETHFRLKYQATPNDSFSLVQRLFYSQAATDAIQAKPALGNLRLEYNRTGNLLGGDASLVTRATLPTGLEARRDYHFLGMATLIPEIYWNLTPKFQLGYSGAGLFEFYDDTADMQGAAATTATFINSAVANYSFTDKVTASQSVGMSEVRRNDRRELNHPLRLSQTVELSTGISIVAAKNVNLGLSVIQSAPTAEGSFDPIKGKPLAYEKDFTLFARDQTTYEFTSSINF